MGRLNVVRLEEYRQKDLIASLESMLESVRRGEVTGIVYIARMRNSEQHAGAVGSYVDDPGPGLVKAIECLVEAQNKKDMR